MAAEAGPSMAVQGAEVNDRARWAGPATTTVGAGVIGLAAFLPWLRSGHATRSSFAMIRTAELLDVVPGLGALAVRAWYLVPLLIAAVWLAAALDRIRLMAALGIVLAIAAGAAATVVLASGVPTGVGPFLALVGAAAVVTGAALTLRPPRSSR